MPNPCFSQHLWMDYQAAQRYWVLANPKEIQHLSQVYGQLYWVFTIYAAGSSTFNANTEVKILRILM